MITKTAWNKFLRDIDSLKLQKFKVFIFGLEIKHTKDERIICKRIGHEIKVLTHPGSFTPYTKCDEMYRSLEIRKRFSSAIDIQTLRK